MSASVLVAYVTRYGSTQEVAEAVAAKLREHGLAVDIGPTREVRTLDQYRAVVLGAPFYTGRWHKDARRFLSRHRAALTQRPVAIFALGLHSRIEKELAQFPWLTPVAVEMFGGKIDPAKLRFSDTLIRAMPPLRQALPAGDTRDFTAIRAWASNLAASLQPALS